MANRESEIRAFTGLRGLACFYVMLYHFGFAGILPKDFSAFANHGYLSVDIFFVLSGFVMAMVYGDYFKNGFDFDNYKKFIARRIARIYPLYFFMTLLFLWFFTNILDEVPKNIPITFFDIAANIFSIQAWGLTSSYVGPAWSISTEWAAYLLLPVLLPITLFASHKPAMTTLGFCAFILVSICILPHDITGVTTSRGLLDMSDGRNYAPLLRCIIEFTIGIITYRFYRTGIFAKWNNTLYFSSIIATAMLALLFIKDSDLVFVILIPLFLISIAYDRHIVAKFLNWRPVYFAGVISYSLYLVHGLVSWLHYQIKQPIYALDLPFPNLFIILSQIFLSVVLATFAYRFIEQPGQVYLRRILEPRQKSFNPGFSLKRSFMQQAFGNRGF